MLTNLLGPSHKSPSSSAYLSSRPFIGATVCLAGGSCLFSRRSSNFARRSFVFIFWWTYESEDDTYVCSLLLERPRHCRVVSGSSSNLSTFLSPQTQRFSRSAPSSFPDTAPLFLLHIYMVSPFFTSVI